MTDDKAIGATTLAAWEAYMRAGGDAPFPPAFDAAIIDALAVAEPLIRVGERRKCADMVRAWLPIRQEMDSEFAAAMQALADKMEARGE